MKLTRKEEDRLLHTQLKPSDLIDDLSLVPVESHSIISNARKRTVITFKQRLYAESLDYLPINSPGLLSYLDIKFNKSSNYYNLFSCLFIYIWIYLFIYLLILIYIFIIYKYFLYYNKYFYIIITFIIYLIIYLFLFILIIFIYFIFIFIFYFLFIYYIKDDDDSSEKIIKSKHMLLNKGSSISFYKNGVNQGTAFEDIPLCIPAAVSLPLERRQLTLGNYQRAPILGKILINIYIYFLFFYFFIY